MFTRVEEIHGLPFWKADIAVTLQHYNSLNKVPDHENSPLLFTTYELYFNYIFKYHPLRCAIREQNSILAYKGRMGVENEELHKVGSRTNLNGNAQVLKPEEENTFKFDCFRESCEHISKRCEELGYDAVTFQNHTRVGVYNHWDSCKEEIDAILTD